MKILKRLGLILLCLVGHNALADEPVSIVIDGSGSDQARLIGVVPFQWNNSTKEVDFSGVVSADLNNSGLFKTLATKDMPQQPTSAHDVASSDWSKLGVGNVLVGQITPKGKDYAVSFQLVDTVGAFGKAGAVLLQKQILVPKHKWREGAHRVTDAVFTKLTGFRGVFLTKIAFVLQKPYTATTKPFQLRVTDYDGNNQYIIYNSSEPLMSPTWSKDGNKIAYSTFENSQSQIVIQDLKTGSRTVAVKGEGNNSAPSFSPNGQYLAFSSTRNGGLLNIYLLNLHTKAVTQLTKNSGNNTEPSWTPKGEIVFTSDRSGSPQIYMMSKNGSNVRQLTDDGRNYNGRVTSDGKSLIMIYNDHLAKKDLESGNVEIIAKTFLDETPSLSPNDLMVIYGSTRGLRKVLQLVSIDGKFKARLPNKDGFVKYPTWSPFLK